MIDPRLELYPHISIERAALILSGIELHETDEVYINDSIANTWARAMDESIRTRELKPTNNILYFTTSDEDHRPYDDQMDISKEFHKVDHSIYIRKDATNINKTELVRWLESKDLHESAELFKEKKNSNYIIHNTNHTTKLMEYMYKAIDEFWTDYDPKQPPKKEMILSWLRQEFGISESAAKSIQMIIRPERYK